MPLSDESTELVGNVRFMHVIDITQQEIVYGEGNDPVTRYRLDYTTPWSDEPWHMDFTPSKRKNSKWGIFVESLKKVGLAVQAGPDFIGGKFLRTEEKPVNFGKTIGEKDMPVVAELYETEEAWREAAGGGAKAEAAGPNAGPDALLEEAYALHGQVKGNEQMFRAVWGQLHPDSDVDGAWAYAVARVEELPL